MMERTFINDFISLGMKSFFDDSDQNIFEKHVIECLCDIYGKENIQKVYTEKNESAFITLLRSYGLQEKIYDNFLRDTIKYETFKQENLVDPTKKSNIASSIELHLITMFLHKCLLKEPTLEELGHFENNLLNNFAIIKLHFNTSFNPNKTRETWEKKKRILQDNVQLVEIKPEYLDEFTYSRFGIKLSDVKNMDYRMVTELNNYIKKKIIEQKEEPNHSNSRPTANTVISTGNGFVDALLLVAVIATELSIGLIYLFLNI